ncbi:hypothetical protein GGD81_002667 [Rhodobium orientis]|uniref:Uncharacterized protein n=1 Tax=Rhodobium orientis TaxID=34017 RepID=A0A327JN17_9HYPH|nr:hypothetical protein [Rhodobium orientis]MBB4303620.1 hypothetical protein [Rhodobium orientis]MBK5951924.1 hypothetical protein [Rhodobium orientis]RAI26773.1 hypothetical protein CH339_12820 [Rhodobium orientis]
MTDGRREADEARRREADAALKRVEREAETIGSSSYTRVARQAADHFSGKDADAGDRIEVWGRRIGRIAGLIFFIGLVLYLVATYVMPK